MRLFQYPPAAETQPLFVLTKIDEILAWEEQKGAEWDNRFVELCGICGFHSTRLAILLSGATNPTKLTVSCRCRSYISGSHARQA